MFVWPHSINDLVSVVVFTLKSCELITQKYIILKYILFQIHPKWKLLEPNYVAISHSTTKCHSFVQDFQVENNPFNHKAQAVFYVTLDEFYLI